MYLGLDIGGSSVKGAVLLPDGSLSDIRSFTAPSDKTPDIFITQLKDFVSEFLFQYPQIETIGIGVPGVVDDAGVVRIAPNLSGWVNIPLKDILVEEFQIPIALDNDANVAGFAELQIGAGISDRHFVFVTLGTGIGGAIIFDRKLFRGAIGGAGEFGHQIINAYADEPNAPLYRQGTLEVLTGRFGILSYAKELLQTSGNNSKLNDLSADFDVHDIANAASHGDALSIRLFEEIGRLIGIGLVNIMNILDIHTAIIGGGIGFDNPPLLDSIRHTISQRALPTIASDAIVKTAGLSKNAGIYGAALIGKYSINI